MATFRAWVETLQNIKLRVELQVRGLKFEVCNGVAGPAGEDNVLAARNRVSNVQASSHLALASIWKSIDNIVCDEGTDALQNS